MTLVGTLDTTVEADRVSFSFTVENDGDDPVILSFRDAHAADFVVHDDGDERWRWSAERMFAQVLQSAELPPGETVTYEGDWEDPEPGTHTARASLEAENEECEARTEFSI